ncbi:tRNA pseudouridine(38-40) synthase TruA [Parvularcula sp. LCG005]|uniref:tRNA pseudouridine(38-40) synthase TruA n=1 Tax=Parvularcula sp. LCG005 TaxID=3078805 RepID=UPI002941F128|nr:tRNA pseudouridine(38-40) synthase TruA [Parvularcula sp. LCG005]WOI53126.1 tRNA pseudouridine(38-40) synthase TruA [Parvularcula sp. LCG005]
MPRYRIDIEYDGTGLVGWQRQDNGPSVQQAIEAAGAALSGAASPVYAAGRTDAGVHAIAMTAHIDLQKAFPTDTVRDGLNAHLRDHRITVLEAAAVDDDFHARFSCTGRHYRYRLVDRRSPPALEQNRVWHVRHALDHEKMQAAASALLGLHDFTTYRSAHCQAKSPVKTLTQFDVERVDGEVVCRLHAPSFLHNQVRSLVGTIAQVGLGRQGVDWPRQMLDACDRTLCGPVAPASGLYFVKADYPA